MKDRISVCAQKAKAMGLSYGQYMAQIREKANAPQTKCLHLCRGCGASFFAKRSNQMYCSEECGERAKNRRKSAKHRQQLAAQLKQPKRRKRRKRKGRVR